jgi:hypothetical protein
VEKVDWTDLLKNNEVLDGVKEKRYILHKINRRKISGLVTSYVETAF